MAWCAVLALMWLLVSHASSVARRNRCTPRPGRARESGFSVPLAMCCMSVRRGTRVYAHASVVVNHSCGTSVRAASAMATPLDERVILDGAVCERARADAFGRLGAFFL